MRSIGPTGDFPNGQLNKEDDGGIRIAVYIENKTVMINFGKAVHWIGLDAGATRGLIKLLSEKLEEIDPCLRW